MLVVLLPVFSENQRGGRCVGDVVVLGEDVEEFQAVDDDMGTCRSVDVVELQIRLIKTQLLE